MKLCLLPPLPVPLPQLLLLLHDPLLLPIIHIPMRPLPLSLIHSMFPRALLLVIEHALVLLQVLGCLLLCLERRLLPI